MRGIRILQSAGVIRSVVTGFQIRELVVFVGRRCTPSDELDFVGSSGWTSIVTRSKVDGVNAGVAGRFVGDGASGVPLGLEAGRGHGRYAGLGRRARLRMNGS